MDEQTRRRTSVSIWLAGAALGAAAMYLADPDRGRRRRALASDKMRSMAYRTSDAIDVARRDLGNRVQGFRAQTGRFFSQSHGTNDDDTVAARVRKEIGRSVSHPRAVKVDVQQGYVTLHGPILAHEKQGLLERVQSTDGVTDLEDRLEVHDSATGIPSLQGEGRRRTAGYAIMRESWPPALSALAAVGGSVLGIYGLTRRSATGIAATAIGLGLLARGLGNQPFSRSLRNGGAEIDLHKAIYIDAAPETVFGIWTKYENFPHFMSNIKEVRDLGNGRSHWVVNGPGGTQIEWNAVTTEARSPEVLAWKTEPDASVQHMGEVRFERAGDGTRVNVHLRYRPPGGIVGHAVASLFNGDPKRQMDEDLMRMKSFVERGAPPHDAAQPTIPASKELH